MKKLSLLLTICLFTVSHFSFSQSSVLIKEYIEQHKELAIQEMIRTGVPAAIKLAQGIHETGAGKSNLVTRSNNHFGIKCKTEWKGESVFHDDDARGECFRKYPSSADSYKDHSDFLRTRSHYAFLFNFDPTDYEAWAHGLKKAGYATNPKYPVIIIKLIKDYNLNDFSLIALGKKTDESTVSLAQVVTTSNDKIEKAYVVAEKEPVIKLVNYPQGIFKINETKVIYITKGTSYFALAREHDIALSKLFEFNEMQAQEEATADHLLYLQRKRKTGKNEFYTVVAGQSLRDIAQAEGIRLESLLELNHLKNDMQPQVGEKLYLQNKAPYMPKLVTDQTTAYQPSSHVKEAGTQNEISNVWHKVEPKETLYAISKKYGVTVDELMNWNNLQAHDLKTGQQLKINKQTNAGSNTSR